MFNTLVEHTHRNVLHRLAVLASETDVSVDDTVSAADDEEEVSMKGPAAKPK